MVPDPLHLVISFGPVAVYLLLLGIINLSSRPMLTTGGRDTAALGVAASGFVIAGPMELFLPEAAAARFGAYVWLLMIGMYALGLVLIVLLQRPRLLVFNTTAEQLRPGLARVVARLDPDARWAGDSLVMPQLGMQLHLEPNVPMKLVQLVASGPQAGLSGWRRLEHELAAELRGCRTGRNPFGYSLVTFSLLMLAAVSWWLTTDAAGIEQALNNMLRR